MRMMTALAIVTIVAAAPTSAFAQDTDHVEKAKELYASAMSEHDEGNYRKAAELLAQAYAYDPNLVYQYNRIRMLQANGDYADALEVARIYEGAMKDDPEGRFPSISKLRAKLEEQAGAAAPQAKAAAAPADAAPADATPAVKATPTAREGVPASGLGAAPTAQQSASTGGVPPWPVIEVGAGVTIVGGILAVCAYDIVLCDSPDEMTPAELESRENRQALFKPLSLAVMAGGVITMGVGAYLLYDKESKKQSVGWQVVPVFGPGQAGAMVNGRF